MGSWSRFGRVESARAYITCAFGDLTLITSLHATRRLGRARERAAEPRRASSALGGGGGRGRARLVAFPSVEDVPEGGAEDEDDDADVDAAEDAAARRRRGREERPIRMQRREAAADLRYEARRCARARARANAGDAPCPRRAEPPPPASRAAAAECCRAPPFLLADARAAAFDAAVGRCVPKAVRARDRRNQAVVDASRPEH